MGHSVGLAAISGHGPLLEKKLLILGKLNLEAHPIARAHLAVKATLRAEVTSILGDLVYLFTVLLHLFVLVNKVLLTLNIDVFDDLFFILFSDCNLLVSWINF
jgi:hypothetical protein